MIYKFKSAASGDVIMLGPQGEQLMQVLGREPASKGIFEAADLPALVARIEAAIAADAAATPVTDDEDTSKPAIGLKQRLWPMLEMMRRCHAAKEPIVWGV